MIKYEGLIMIDSFSAKGTDLAKAVSCEKTHAISS